jgi:hypothetical protein
MSRTYPGRSGRHTVRVKIQRQTHASENVLEHSNKLKGKHVLPTVIANFEDRLDPQVLFCATLFLSTIASDQGIRVGIDDHQLFSHFERRHKWCL